MKIKAKELDLLLMIIPLTVVIGLCVLFFLYPEQSILVTGSIRDLLGENVGWFYMLLGLGIFLITIFVAFSKYGKIRLGNTDKPQYTNFQWAVMIFTSTMAADILYYSCSEWALYSGGQYFENVTEMELWSPTYSLFHWGPIPWGFYLILAVAFGFMIHVCGRTKQKFSESLRPLFGDKVDGVLGRGIDLIAIFALLAGTATTFSVATPLLSEGLCDVFHLEYSVTINIVILIIIAIIYTWAVLTGFKGILFVAKICTFLFLGLVLWVLLLSGDTVYIIESGVTAIGNMTQNFLSLATNMDPSRNTGFVQDWTIFYWAYWLVWCIATPFFIGVISKGRTIKNVILGGYMAGLAGTFTSFIVFENFGLAKQMQGTVDVITQLAKGVSVPRAVLNLFQTLPFSQGAILLLVITMVAFYASTFDTLTMVISIYSYRNLDKRKEPSKKIRAFWAVLFIILPIGLLAADSSMHSLQSVAIIAAFPVGVIVILIVWSFFKEATKYLKKEG
ncbi:MAG: BCCT family transporter [Lachnospiraceae bacterium]